MITRALTQAELTNRLTEAPSEILGLGVRRLALFGSVQRDAARTDSDVDILVEFEPGQKTYDRFVAPRRLPRPHRPWWRAVSSAR